MKGGLADERPVRPTIVSAVIQIRPRVQEKAPPAKYRGKALGIEGLWTSANSSAERRNSPPGSGYDSPPPNDPVTGRGRFSGQGRLKVAPAFTARCKSVGFP